LGVSAWVRKPIDDLKAQLTPRTVEKLIGTAGEASRAEHMRVFETTPKGTLAQTFYALGATVEEVESMRWRNFRAVLARDDQLLDVSRMLHLLDDLGLAPHQIQVVRGDHFFFSVSDDNHQAYLRNREIVVGDILHLHEVCRERQRI
jgi:hypothetical protein